MNSLEKLGKLGQSIWYDNISRGLILRGELKKMVDEGITGVTSNPTIFDKAISGSAEYDDQIRELVDAKPDIRVADIIQALMVSDIQMAADVLMPVYERTGRHDGYVSIEVTPHKAHDTVATIEEVRLLWKKVARKNLMIKIPATSEGLPAIEQAISESVNINVTPSLHGTLGAIGRQTRRAAPRGILTTCSSRGPGGSFPTPWTSTRCSSRPAMSWG